MGKAITSRTVETWPHLDKRQEVPDSKIKGLYLVVQPRPSTAKSWAVRYRMHGKPSKYTIGKYPNISLADARSKATDVLQSVEDGFNPSKSRKALVRSNNLSSSACSKALNEYKRMHLDTLRSGDKAHRFLEVALVEMLGDPRLSSVSRLNIQNVIDELNSSGRGVTANRVLTHCKTFFDWCVAREHCEVSPTVGIKKPFKEQPKDRVLTDDEIKLFWNACDKVYATYGKLGKLLLLTGQRLGEVSQMTYELVEDGIWKIPKGITKNGRAHSVPICPLAHEIITQSERPQLSGFVVSVTGDKPMSNFNRAKSAISEVMESLACSKIEPWTFHDLRRTYATGMQSLGVQIPVTEALLNHVSGSRSGIVGVYQKHEYQNEKLAASKLWSAHLLGLISNG